MSKRLRRLQQNGSLLALPTVAWLVIFFVLPLLIVLVVSFMTRGRGGVGQLPFTPEHYERTFGVFFIILQRSIGLAALTTVVCLLVGYPLAFFIATRRRLVQQIALFLVILPSGRISSSAPTPGASCWGKKARSMAF